MVFPTYVKVVAATGRVECPMPSLFRLLVFLGMLGGLGYGALYALAQYGELHPREITVTITPDKFIKN